MAFCKHTQWQSEQTLQFFYDAISSVKMVVYRSKFKKKHPNIQKRTVALHEPVSFKAIILKS